MTSPCVGHRISRRELLRLGLALGRWAATAPLMQACGRAEAPADTPVATAGPTSRPVKEEEMVAIALVKTRDRAKGVRRAVALFGQNPVQGKQVLLKPNFNSADPAPASTHLDTLRALVQELWEMGAASITVADRSGMGLTPAVMDRLGVPALAEELGFAVLSLEDLGAEDWEMVNAAGSHWKAGFPMARPCLEAGALVQTCCLKPHRFGGHFTMSLKNSVGMVAARVPGGNHDYMGELHGSPHQRRMIAEINAAYEPDLVVLDGVEAFVSAGPDRGKHAWGEVVLAGTDRVAIDAVGLALLKHLGYAGMAGRGAIFAQQQIARAVELGLGVDAPEKIRLVTDDADSAAYAAVIGEVLLQG